MADSNQQVTVEIKHGPSANVPWTSGMNAQQAIEAAWNQINSAQTFTYGLQYFGSTYGYLVFMINETYDSFVSSAAPYYYWEFFVNGVSQNQGIDSTILKAGDVVLFTFSLYVPQTHAGTSLAKKAEQQQQHLAAK